MFPKKWLGTFLELPGGIPSHDTINQVFQMIDPNRFHDAFFQWTKASAGKIEGVVAICKRPAPHRHKSAEAGKKLPSGNCRQKEKMWL